MADYWLLKNNYDVSYMLERNRKNVVGKSRDKVLAMYEQKIRQVIK
ncbi:hypothetical protein AB3538_07635 [Acinetobacter baumannii]